MDDLNTLKWFVWPLIIAIALLERWLRADPRPGLGKGWQAPARFRRRLRTNLSLALINGLQSSLAITGITLFAVSWGVSWRPADWPLWSQLLVDILLLDLLLYSWHRLAHEVPLLWRLHEVHHLDEELDASSALRFHFLEPLLSMVYRLPFLVLLDIPLVSVALFEALVLLAAVFHHSNLKLPQKLERGLAWLVITPSLHWVHHHAIRADTDSTYGTIFSFWDRLFQSTSRSVRHEGQKIGVEGRREAELLALLWRPFSVSKAKPPHS